MKGKGRQARSRVAPVTSHVTANSRISTRINVTRSRPHQAFCEALCPSPVPETAGRDSHRPLGPAPTRRPVRSSTPAAAALEWRFLPAFPGFHALCIIRHSPALRSKFRGSSFVRFRKHHTAVPPHDLLHPGTAPKPCPRRRRTTPPSPLRHAMRRRCDLRTPRSEPVE